MMDYREFQRELSRQRERLDAAEYLYSLAEAASRRGDIPTYQRRLQEALAALQKENPDAN